MAHNRLAEVLSQWAGGLAEATRNQLSTYDLTALYDRMAATPEDPARVAEAAAHWLKELGPGTQAMLSSYDIIALCRGLGQPGLDNGAAHPSKPDPTALGPPSKPEHARAGGYTGETCGVCGSMAVVRTGTCTTCQDCGSQTGCG